MILAASCVLAQDAVKHTLRYDFDGLAGKTAIYTVETELKQTVTHDGRGGAQGTRWRRDTLEQSYRRKGVSGRIRQRRTRIELRVLSADSPTPRAFDSDTDEQPPEGLEAQAAGLGRVVTLELTRRGQVTRVRGVRDAIERAGYAASFLRFPKDPLAVGEGWSRPAVQRVPYPPFGALLYHTHYTLEQIRDDGGFLIRAKINILFEPAPPPEDGSSQPAVKIDAQEAGGTLEFTAHGLLTESRFRSALVIKITSGDTERTEVAKSTTIQRLLQTLTPKQKRERDAKAGRDAK